MKVDNGVTAGRALSNAFNPPPETRKNMKRLERI
jgi:hypothetical protein